MKTQEELQRELFIQTSEVENAICKLDKADMMLGHWVNEYVFTDRPDLSEAVKAWTSRDSEAESKMAKQSIKWFYEYNLIIGFIDIVYDYVHASKKVLKKAVYDEQGNKGA